MVLSSLKPIGLFSRRYPDAPRCRGFSNRSPADHSLLSHHGTLLTCAVSSRLSWSHLRSRGLVGGLANLAGSLWVLYKPTEKNAWRMFKVSSPYLFLLFIAIIVDVALRY